MAALVAAGVHNCVIVTNGPELPIFDGSSRPILEAIAATGGTIGQNAVQPILEILKPVHVCPKNNMI